MCCLIPGPTPCPEVVAVSYIRLAKVLTLCSVEGDAPVEQKNHKCGFLTSTSVQHCEVAAVSTLATVEGTLTKRCIANSDGKVCFGLVQGYFCRNPELDLGVAVISLHYN